MHRMALVALMFAIAGCQQKSAAPVKSSLLGETCSRSEDCATDLRCVDATCVAGAAAGAVASQPVAVAPPTRPDVATSGLPLSPQPPAVVPIAAPAPAPPECRRADAPPFEVHGEGARAGVVRWYHTGAVFSRTGGEGGTESLVFGSTTPQELTLQVRSEPWKDSGRRKTTTRGKTVRAEHDGTFSVSQVGMTVSYEDHKQTQRGRYRIAHLGEGCFRVQLTHAIPPFEGE